MRRAAKRDDSERAIVQAFELAGASVWRLSDPNLPDLLVGWRLQTHPVECKTGKRKQSKGQADAALLWRGTPVEVVRTPDEAKALVERWRTKYAGWMKDRPPDKGTPEKTDGAAPKRITVATERKHLGGW